MSESMAQSGEEFFEIKVDISTSRVSQREHPMVFRLQQSTSSASVVSEDDQTNPFLDAIFGTKTNPDGPIQEEFVLEALVDTIPSLSVKIRNDFHIEEEECFTIRLFRVDIPDRLELFECNDEGSNSFCEHTICIEDDDGENLSLIYIFYSHGCFFSTIHCCFWEEHFHSRRECGCSECLYQPYPTNI